jgi:hypothetical protein
MLSKINHMKKDKCISYVDILISQLEFVLVISRGWESSGKENSSKLDNRYPNTDRSNKQVYCRKVGRL